jgi:hypothetical protein
MVLDDLRNPFGCFSDVLCVCNLYIRLVVDLEGRLKIAIIVGGIDSWEI